MQKTYQFTTQCKGDISSAFKTAKITVFDPMMCKSPDVPLQAELLRLTIQLRTSQASVLALLNGWEYQFKLGTYYIILQVINTAARLVRAHVDFFTSWGQTIDIYYPDTVLPIHTAWHGEATAKSTTKYGRR